MQLAHAAFAYPTWQEAGPGSGKEGERQEGGDSILSQRNW